MTDKTRTLIIAAKALVERHPESMVVEMSSRHLKGPYRALEASVLAANLGVKPGGWLKQQGPALGLKTARIRGTVPFFMVAVEENNDQGM